MNHLAHQWTLFAWTNKVHGRLRFLDWLAYKIENLGDRLIAWSVRIRKPGCKCAICHRDWERVLNQWEDAILDRMDVEREAGLCAGESR